jgi:putative transposase
MSTQIPKVGNLHLLASLAAFGYEGLRHAASAGERREIRKKKLAEYQRLTGHSDDYLSTWPLEDRHLADLADEQFRSPLMTRLVVPEVDAVFHICSRLAGEARLLGDEEKSMFCRQLELVANYCGVEVLNYSVLDNHFHLLVEVPKMGSRSTMPREMLLAKIEILHPELARLLREALSSGDLAKPGSAVAHFGAAFLRAGVDVASPAESASEWAGREMERHRGLMCCLESFVRLLKQRFTIWFNGTHDRFGTLWADRFRSMLVESTAEAVHAVSAYIDLNAVRRGLVEDAAEYPFCSLGAARRGSAFSQSMLRRRLGFGAAEESGTWAEVVEQHRSLLWGNTEGKPRSYAQLPSRLGRPLVLADLFRYSQPVLSSGLALGSADFAKKVFQANRSFFKADGTRRGDWLQLEGGALHGWVVTGLTVLQPIKGR